jgi:ferric-dicitrate binding protein FerR (iron transport regulator)
MASLLNTVRTTWNNSQGFRVLSKTFVLGRWSMMCYGLGQINTINTVKRQFKLQGRTLYRLKTNSDADFQLHHYQKKLLLKKMEETNLVLLIK